MTATAARAHGAASLDAMFRPASIAVVGASAAPDKAGHAMVRALRDFPGTLHLVNPRGGEVLGRAVIPSLREASDVDLAVLVVPPDAVPGALEDARAAGTRAAVVCAGGFAESGPAGARVQERVVAVAREAGIRLLGPNTSGFVNPVDRTTANFMPAVADLPPGTVGLVAQSGGVNLALAFLLARAGVGLRLGVGLGNAVDVDFPEVLDHLALDDATTAVGLHVEGVADGPALLAALRRTTARKPVVALKVGRSDVSEFARSHTGALTGSYAVTRAALQQSGAVVVDSLEELVAALVALRSVRLPAAARIGVGLVTGQAGPGLVVTDALGARGVALPPLTDATQLRLAQLLPPLTFQRNPVDTGRPSPTFGPVVRTVLDDPGVDVVGVYALDEPGALDPAAALAPLAGRVLLASGGPADALAERRHCLDAVGVPVLAGPGDLATALAAVAADAQVRAVHDAPPVAPTRTVGRTLDEHEAKTLLEGHGLRTPRRHVATDRAQAHAALADLVHGGGRAVVKVLAADVPHKSDVGGVHVGVRDDAGLDRALDAIDAIPRGADPDDRATDGAGPDVRAPRRYLIEELAAPGPELIVGAVRDPVFGPVVLLGLGGVAAELGGEPVLRLAPLSAERAHEMVRALPPAVLHGFRGAPPVDVAALADVLRAVGDVVTTYGDVTELDLNPVRLTADGPVVLDALVVADPATLPGGDS
ncbi:CoA-binding domain protein [Cellulomonas flavigena DSM 20109]|uniref:CoA-binding domain protein n=1 Tax=Cellulomonas flavigena (strain ATCC 482 / DSM 20109 / BCRC 11376 / JCM 18109 / NBRC 3775 / NCIMB 8073 / NRS 134) TaxID=446466 RepID=D5UH12_CELFN|nr:acetate--CoA ligase family protein [Cellulomonas flavigena]ADG73215.1 CoA-binding domain protein [Cellulomonas flavigena DSM 20109]